MAVTSPAVVACRGALYVTGNNIINYFTFVLSKIKANYILRIKLEGWGEGVSF